MGRSAGLAMNSISLLNVTLRTSFGNWSPPRGENVVDLMDALRKSVGGAATGSQSPKKPAKKTKNASAGQKEMLMPIAGKKPAKEATAKKPASRTQRKSA